LLASRLITFLRHANSLAAYDVIIDMLDANYSPERPWHLIDMAICDWED